MPAKPRWADLDCESSARSQSRPHAATWDTQRWLEAGDSAADDAAPVATGKDAFAFSLDDISLRTGVAVMELPATAAAATATAGMPSTRRPRGNEFFYLLMHSSLRRGGSARLLHPKYLGYAVCAVCAAITAGALEAAAAWLPPQQLGLANARELNELLHLSWAAVLPLGLVSDTFAPLGFHRKSLLVLAWGILAAVWTLQFVCFQFSRELFSAAAPPPSTALALGALAMLALGAIRLVLDVRIIELSQQEDLSHRGRLAAMYQVTSLLPKMAVRMTTLLLLSSPPADEDRPDPTDEHLELPMSVSMSSLVLLAIALIPIPFLYLCAHEAKAVPPSESLSTGCCPAEVLSRLGATCHRLWDSAHCKAVSNLLTVSCVLFFFGELEYAGASQAVFVWSGETPRYQLARLVIVDAAVVGVLLLWRRSLLNVSWLSCLVASVMLWKATALTGTLVVVLGAVREPWFPTIIELFGTGATTFFLLIGMIHTTEVVDTGAEGSLYGWLVSFQLLLKIVAGQVIVGIESTGVLPGPEQLRPQPGIATAPVSQTRIAVGATVITLLSLLCLLAVFYLPRQKTQAQQQRVFGGFSRPRRTMLVVGFAVVYPLVAALQLFHGVTSSP